MLDRVEGDRWFAIGDAASVLDPIASQGIFKALADAADATDTIAAAAGRRAPPPWSYTERVATRFEDYLANRAHLYGLERRWADAPFWRQRAMVGQLSGSILFGGGSMISGGGPDHLVDEAELVDHTRR